MAGIFPNVFVDYVIYLNTNVNFTWFPDPMGKQAHNVSTQWLYMFYPEIINTILN